MTDIKLLFIATLPIYKIESLKAFILPPRKIYEFLAVSSLIFQDSEMLWKDVFPALGQPTPGGRCNFPSTLLEIFFLSAWMLLSLCNNNTVLPAQLCCIFRGWAAWGAHSVSLQRVKGENHFGEQALLFRPKLLKNGLAFELFVTMGVHSLLFTAKEKACTTCRRYQNA